MVKVVNGPLIASSVILTLVLLPLLAALMRCVWLEIVKPKMGSSLPFISLDETNTWLEEWSFFPYFSHDQDAVCSASACEATLSDLDQYKTVASMKTTSVQLYRCLEEVVHYKARCLQEYFGTTLIWLSFCCVCIAFISLSLLPSFFSQVWLKKFVGLHC